MNLSTAKKICNALEIGRWICVVLGFQFAFSQGTTPQDQLHILTPWIVVSLAGLTGIESVFFGQAASQLTGYAPSAYQRQSGINNLAVAITALLAFFLQWGTYAEITVMTTLLIFLFLSASNHAWSAWKEGNHTIKNLLRPVLTVLLIAFVLPVMIGAITHT